jgi:hypothetical protein
MKGNTMAFYKECVYCGKETRHIMYSKEENRKPNCWECGCVEVQEPRK